MTDHRHPDAIVAAHPLAAGEELLDNQEGAGDDDLSAWELMQEASSQELAHTKRRLRRPRAER